MKIIFRHSDKFLSFYNLFCINLYVIFFTPQNTSDFNINWTPNFCLCTTNNDSTALPLSLYLSHIDARPHIAYTPWWRPSQSQSLSRNLRQLQTWPQNALGWLVAGWLFVDFSDLLSALWLFFSSELANASLRLLNEWDYAMDAHEVSHSQKKRKTRKKRNKK